MNDLDKNIISIWGAKNLEKVRKNMREGPVESKKKFLKKYPNADTNKFSFDVDLNKNGDIIKHNAYFKFNDDETYDITSDTFKNNKKWTKYLSMGFGIWGLKDEIPKFQKLEHPNNPTRQGWGHYPITDSSFQTPINLDYKLNNFKIYLSETEYFLSEFSPISEDWRKGKTLNEKVGWDIRKFPLDYEKEPYFAMVCATYVASFLCGISLKHLSEETNEVSQTKSEDTPKIITSIARYHLYYQIRKFMEKPSLLNKFKSHFQGPVKKYLPIKHIDLESVGKDGDGHKYFFKGSVNYSSTDYKSFVAYDSRGLTKIGQSLLQQSIESYVYCVLGAQSNTRWPIVGKGAMSLQTQEVFRKLLNVTIIQDDKTVAISDMRKAIKDTNVVLNMAISPGVILVPSNMIILDKMIAGYNNILTVADSKMVFGKNDDLNYVRPTPSSKKSVISKLPSLNSKSVRTPLITSKSTPTLPIISDQQNVNLPILVVAIITGSLISKFVI